MVKRIKDNKNKKLVYSLIIAAIMIFSVVGFMGTEFFGQNDKIDYKGKPIYNENNQWFIKYNKEKIYFEYNPEQLEDVLINDDMLNTLNNSNLALFGFDPSDESYDSIDLQFIELMRFDLETKMPPLFNIFISSGVINPSEDYNLPQVTCENATVFIPVIQVIRGDTNLTVSQTGRCITIKARTGQEFNRFKEKLFYSLLGYR